MPPSATRQLAGSQATQLDDCWPATRDQGPACRVSSVTPSRTSSGSTRRQGLGSDALKHRGGLRWVCRHGVVLCACVVNVCGRRVRLMLLVSGRCGRASSLPSESRAAALEQVTPPHAYPEEWKEKLRREYPQIQPKVVQGAPAPAPPSPRPERWQRRPPEVAASCRPCPTTHGSNDGS